MRTKPIILITLACVALASSYPKNDQSKAKEEKQSGSKEETTDKPKETEEKQPDDLQQNQPTEQTLRQVPQFPAPAPYPQFGVPQQQIPYNILQPHPLQYLEPQYNYPVYNQQAFPRIQPSILLYNAGGQGQPILINPGSPPGNFLIPQQPGTNVFLRGSPQIPMFVGGYPNPKPAHIPPIEKDAEEVPTDAGSIPPLMDHQPRDKKPEKLETFTEDNIGDFQPTIRPNQIHNTPNLRPGQRFFILNGQPLYQNYPETLQKQQDPNPNLIPIQTFLLHQQPDLNIDQQNPQPTFRYEPSNVPMGQFRFAPPNDPYFPLNNESDDDSVVINASYEEPNRFEHDLSISMKSSDPSTAQAAPGAVALAGPGGVAGASPKATALAGKGGLAVSSPKATAIAGTKDEDNKVNKKD